MIRLILCFLFVLPSLAIDEKILYGRKDSIRNDLIKSNNELCLAIINSSNAHLNGLNQVIFRLELENSALKNTLRACQENTNQKKK